MKVPRAVGGHTVHVLELRLELEVDVAEGVERLAVVGAVKVGHRPCRDAEGAGEGRVDATKDPALPIPHRLLLLPVVVLVEDLARPEPRPRERVGWRIVRLVPLTREHKLVDRKRQPPRHVRGAAQLGAREDVLRLAAPLPASPQEIQRDVEDDLGVLVKAPQHEAVVHLARRRLAALPDPTLRPLDVLRAPRLVLHVHGVLPRPRVEEHHELQLRRRQLRVLDAQVVDTNGRVGGERVRQPHRPPVGRAAGRAARPLRVVEFRLRRRVVRVLQALPPVDPRLGAPPPSAFVAVVGRLPDVVEVTPFADVRPFVAPVLAAPIARFLARPAPLLAVRIEGDRVITVVVVCVCVCVCVCGVVGERARGREGERGGSDGW